MLTSQQILDKASRLKALNGSRDAMWSKVAKVRAGRIYEVAPHLFNEQFPEPIVANALDVAAREFAEASAELPTISCSSAAMLNDRARKAADKKTKIALTYVDFSRLDSQWVSAEDYYYSQGLKILRVEPDFESKTPRMLVEDPTGGYAEVDRWGDCRSYLKTITRTAGELCVLFPEFSAIIEKDKYGRKVGPETELELYHYHDKDQDTLLLPGRDGLVLRTAANPVGKCLVVIGRRPSPAGATRGQFDDVVWIQIARNHFANLQLEAADKAVGAPIVVPSDVDELSFGQDGIISTNNPAGVGRVRLDIPQGVFQEQAQLAQEQNLGARLPEGRTGSVQASVITGQGIEALAAGFNGIVAISQKVTRELLKRALELCFEVDEKLWPNDEKSIRGVQDGSPFEITYVPAKDIKGDYTVDVSFGMLGMDRNRALVFQLQMLGAGLVSKETVQRMMPFAVDVTQESARMDIEGLQTALLSGVSQMAVAIPQMASQGADPSTIVKQLADIVARRQKGDSLEEAILTVLTPPKPDPATQDPLAPAGTPPAGGDPLAALGGGGGGQPDLTTLLAGLSGNGQPTLSASVQRTAPAVA